MQPFDQDAINSHFTKGTDNGDGTRSPSGFGADEVQYFAIKVDSEDGVLGVGTPLKAGLLLQDNGHNGGEQILNSIGAFSTNLPQTISNEVVTSILDYPGVLINISPEKEIIEACEEDIIYVRYHSDVGTNNEKVIITTTFATGLELQSITHQWNEKAIADGLTPPTEVELSPAQYTGTTTAEGEQQYIFDVTNYLGNDLRTLN